VRNIAALRQGLRDLGYVEGQNITIEYRFAERVSERLSRFAAELVAVNPMVIVVGSTLGIVSASKVTASADLQALCVSWSPVFNTNRARITTAASSLRLPAIYGFREFAQSGGLMSYGPDLPDLYRRGATYVDKILKGARAGELPLQLAEKYELVINLKAAKALGLTISESCFVVADEVIE
jgi:putative ABC transport system substrate-binding protein